MEYFEEFKRMPLLRMLIPFVAGIIIGYYVLIPFQPLIFATVFTFTLLLLVRTFNFTNGNYSVRWLYGLILNIFILLISMSLMGKRIQDPSFLEHAHKGGHALVRVLEFPDETENSYRILAEPLIISSSDSIFRTSGKAIIWLEKEPHAGMLKTGDRLIVPNRFSKIRNSGNPFEFNYEKYMRNQGVYGNIYVAANSWYLAERGADNHLYRLAGKLREHFLSVIGSFGINGREYAVAGALLLGDRSELDNDLRQSYADSGAMHILAVSGLHVGILYVLLIRILRTAKKIRYFRLLRIFAIIIVIWGYAMITGLSPSVTRSATMFSIVALAGSVNRKTNIYNTLATAAFIQLLADPFVLFSVGFQLSYLAVAGIAFYQPRIYKLIHFRNSIADKIWIITTVSISAQLLIFPLIVYYFNQFPNYFLITNVFAIPTAIIILYSGILLFVFSAIPVLSSLIALLLNASLFCLNFITDTISLLPFSHVSDIVISAPVLIILYGIILFMSLFFILRKPGFLMVAIVLGMSGLILRAERSFKSNDNQILIIYNSGNTPYYNFISGKDNILVSGTDVKTEAGSIPYVAVNPAIHLNTDKIRQLSLNDFVAPKYENRILPIYVKNDFVSFNKYRIYIVPDKTLKQTNTFKPVHVDLALVSSGSVNLEQIENFVVPGLVVFDSSVSHSKKSEMIQRCNMTGLSYHDVRASGAFVARTD